MVQQISYHWTGTLAPCITGHNFPPGSQKGLYDDSPIVMSIHCICWEHISPFFLFLLNKKIADGERHSAQCKIHTYQPTREEVKNIRVFGDIRRGIPKKFASSFCEGVTFGRVPSFPDDPKCTQDTKFFLPLPSDLSRPSRLNCVNFSRKQHLLMHNFRRSTQFTHRKRDFTLKLLGFLHIQLNSTKK